MFLGPLTGLVVAAPGIGMPPMFVSIGIGEDESWGGELGWNGVWWGDGKYWLFG
jgi:hypothetical protein